jgi:hypothetical protein
MNARSHMYRHTVPAEVLATVLYRWSTVVSEIEPYTRTRLTPWTRTGVLVDANEVFVGLRRQVLRLKMTTDLFYRL